MINDDIGEQRYNTRLAPISEAAETYDYNRFHVPGCKQDKCNGKCGQGDPKLLTRQIKARKDQERKRREREASEVKKRYRDQGSPSQKEKLEEPGDKDFVDRAKDEADDNDDLPAKRQKKRHVRFAE
ncbi:MAG: hypothetical protein Q9220_005226 [cf. Caloplaca sp. 1 TL-2023]